MNSGVDFQFWFQVVGIFCEQWIKMFGLFVFLTHQKYLKI